MQERVQAYIEQHRLLSAGERVVVGVSGGVDSVVLLDVLQQLGYEVVVAHMNYALRTEAVDEAQGVRAMCEAAGLSCFVSRPATQERAAAQQQSVQEAARHLRYDFFQAVAAEVGAAQVAVGHHRDDQAETLLLHLIRGTGLEGLAGMPPQRRLGAVTLVRPLLGCTRAEIVAYAAEKGLRWWEDASNADEKYARSFIRHQVLPLLQEKYGTAVSGRFAQTAAQVRGYLEADFLPTLARHFSACTTAPRSLDLDKLLALPTVWQGRVVLEALKTWVPDWPRTAEQVAQVRALADAQPGKRLVWESFVIWRDRQRLVFGESSRRDTATELPIPGKWEGGWGEVAATSIPRPFSLKPSNPYTIYLDPTCLRGTAQVRPWQDGDRLVPFGRRSEKLVSDLLTDAKVPSHHRAGWPVLADDEGVLWVIGVRPAERTRLGADVADIIKIESIPAWGA